MHTSADTLLPEPTSLRASNPFGTSISRLKAEGGKQKNILLPTPGMLRK
jgi:hypothetical protein